MFRVLAAVFDVDVQASSTPRRYALNTRFCSTLLSHYLYRPKLALTHPENFLDVGPSLEMRRDAGTDQLALTRQHCLQIPVTFARKSRPVFVATIRKVLEPSDATVG